MTPEVKYERIGKFIFGAYRHGGDIVDVCNWMADELEMARPAEGDKAALESLQAAYFARFASDEAFSGGYQRFVKMLEQRGVQGSQ